MNKNIKSIKCQNIEKYLITVIIDLTYKTLNYANNNQNLAPAHRGPCCCPLHTNYVKYIPVYMLQIGKPQRNIPGSPS